MAPRRATPRSLRSLPERRTSPGARPVPYSTVRIRRSEQYRPPRAGRPFGRARTCEALESSPPSQAVSKGSLFLVRASPEQTDVAQPAGRVPILCICSWKKSAPFGISDFWTRLSTSFFSKFSRWEVGGSTVEKPNLGSDVARGAPGRDWLKKKTMTEQTVQGLRGELPIRRETGDWRPYGTRIGLGAHPEPRAGVQLAKRGPRDSAIRGPDPSRTLNAHARFHAPLSLKWPLSLPPPPP